MDNAEPMADLVARYQAGDPGAAGRLFACYARRLTQLAERHLSQKLAGRLDGEDVVQSVFRIFFRRTAAGEFEIDSSGQLWQLLVQITVRKARAAGRRHTAAVRDVGAEEPGGPALLPEVVAHEPRPEEAAALVDEIEALLRGLPPAYCHILEMRLQGHEVAAIARQLAVSRQTVYRALHLLQQRLTHTTEGPG